MRGAGADVADARTGDRLIWDFGFRHCGRPSLLAGREIKRRDRRVILPRRGVTPARG